MTQKRNNQSFAGFVFGFLLLIIISLIVLVVGISTYDGSKSETEAAEQEQIKEDDTAEQEKDEIAGEDGIEEGSEHTDSEIEESADPETVGDETSESETAEEETGKEEITEEKVTEEESVEEEASEEAYESIEETAEDESQYGRLMYKQLEAEEKGIYNIVQQTLEKGEGTCTIERINGTEEAARGALVRAIDAVYFDYPEYFWFNHNSQWQYWLYDGFVKVELELCSYEYWDYVLDKNGYKKAVNEKAQEIANLAMKCESTFDRVKFVHDYLVTYAEYDYVALEEITQTVQKASSQQSHSVYGCLVSQLAVCDGYAKTFQMIMNLLGIECEYVEGDAGGGHAWNYIVLDNESYWMDVTWDDYDRRDENGNMAYPNGADYAYFCITSEELYDTHTPNATFEIPNCTATQYNFFHHEDSYLESYSYDAFCGAIEEQKDEQIISVKFGSENEMNRAIQDLFTTNYRYGELPYIGGKELMYGYDNTRYILNLLFE